jgi:hypothetical protein
MLRAGIAGAAVAALLLTGCGESGRPQGQGQAPTPVTGSFVGTAEDGNTFVAVVADKPKAQDQPRQVSVYACDGEEQKAWFVGKAQANEAEVPAPQGPGRATVRLHPDAAKGALMLEGGQRLAFGAAPARPGTGLFQVTVRPSGRIEGTSWDGAKLSGTLGDEGASGGAPVEAEVAGGGARPLKLEAQAADASPGEYRWIVLPDGQVKGGKNKGSRGFIDPTDDF